MITFGWHICFEPTAYYHNTYGFGANENVSQFHYHSIREYKQCDILILFVNINSF